MESKGRNCGTLVEIFVSLIAKGEVPEEWRIANVVPLFKQDCKEKTKNYRLASLMAVVGKLLERQDLHAFGKAKND